jgi:hypothetical protein
MSTNNPYAGMTYEELLRSAPPIKRKPRPEKPKLELVASQQPNDGSRVASVALNDKDVATVRQALAGRRVRIGPDEVSFDKVTHARVTMRWTRATPAPPPPLVVSAYNPFANERLPGYEADDE